MRKWFRHRQFQRRRREGQAALQAREAMFRQFRGLPA